MLPVKQTLGNLKLVPVVKIEKAEDALLLGKALLNGGLPCAEITFRTTAAADAINSLSKNLPEMLVGAGTVLSVDQGKKAVDAGAKFIVAPGFNPKVVNWCLKQDIPIFPGVSTPTEIEMALDVGLTLLKYFPAEAMGGINMLKAISAPYGEVKFIPTGGLNAQNLGSYLHLPMVFACGGSWFVKSNLITAGNFEEITTLTKEAVSIVQQHPFDGVDT